MASMEETTGSQKRPARDEAGIAAVGKQPAARERPAGLPLARVQPYAFRFMVSDPFLHPIPWVFTLARRILQFQTTPGFRERLLIGDGNYISAPYRLPRAYRMYRLSERMMNAVDRSIRLLHASHRQD